MQNDFRSLGDAAESELIETAKAGSVDAFSELLKRSRPAMLRMARTLLNTPEEVEDALQNASWKAYQHLSTFQQKASFNTWIVKIVLNQARMRMRQVRQAKLVSLDDSFDLRPQLGARLTSDTRSEDLYASEELRYALRQEIRRLPVHFRQIMLLHIEDSSMAEMAARLDVTISAAKSRLLRARHCLIERMRRYLERTAVPV